MTEHGRLAQPMDETLHAAAVAARGFMPTDEGDALFEAGLATAEAVDVAPTLAALVGAPPPPATVGHALIR